MPRHVTTEPLDPRERFGLYRLCDCPTCDGAGKLLGATRTDGYTPPGLQKCEECRGEGRVRQEVATARSPEAVGVALVTLAREGEFEECPFGLLDRLPECPTCGGAGKGRPVNSWSNLTAGRCRDCKGSGVKPTGTWLVLPWTASPRNVRDAARTLARSKKSRPTQ